MSIDIGKKTHRHFPPPRDGRGVSDVYGNVEGIGDTPFELVTNLGFADGETRQSLCMSIKFFSTPSILLSTWPVH